MSDEPRDDAPSLPLVSASDLSLNLDRQRLAAKKLRNDIRAQLPEALLRLSSHHPRGKHLAPEEIKLSDAQLVVAREAGLSSWPALKKHVEDMETVRKDIELGAAAPDASLPTLHIRCGNDIEQALKLAGFTGDFLQYADPICQGPLVDSPHALQQRAEFIASEYPGEAVEPTLAKLQAAEDRLNAARSYGRIVLWFEHDPYDQILLVKLLNQFRKAGLTGKRIELVSLERFPGISKFIGIGQLSPTALRLMFSRRQTVPESAFALAEKTWSALTGDDPGKLVETAQSPSPALPFLRRALSRYLSEMPGTANGLSFTEQAILTCLREGPLPWGKVFARFMQTIDPLPFHGDLMFLGTMVRLRDAGRPAVSCPETSFHGGTWGQAVFSLTPVGHALLAGEIDWKDCAPRLRQQGGISFFDDADWRFDRERQEALKTGVPVNQR
ncbi:DUF1835 domain-containing protein [Roseibium suaedae]|uniref:DUF1835 domain-containing protein n=1 Tax=Roseibium suaedae TaxID=735517 RepID=A0A1M6ZBB9_9HYPH|nr:DUF1835 domain-containing protein [Roseibium suaedae]SHL27801.1 protein of unknown function [Roseibium suaedae]